MESVDNLLTQVALWYMYCIQHPRWNIIYVIDKQTEIGEQVYLYVVSATKFHYEGRQIGNRKGRNPNAQFLMKWHHQKFIYLYITITTIRSFRTIRSSALIEVSCLAGWDTLFLFNTLFLGGAFQRVTMQRLISGECALSLPDYVCQCQNKPFGFCVCGLWNVFSHPFEVA